RARRSARIAGMLDAMLRAFGAAIEIQPPHDDAAEHGAEECDQGRCIPRELGEGCAGYEQGFTERDDDEQRAALGHVAAIDVPVRDGGSAETGNPEQRPGTDELDSERQRPPRESHTRLRQATDDPAGAGDREPDADPLKVVAESPRRTPHGPD